MKFYFAHDLPVPRVYATLSPDYENTALIVGFELSARLAGAPLLRLEWEIPWRRPRPDDCDLLWPSRGASNVFRWRRRGAV